VVDFLEVQSQSPLTLSGTIGGVNIQSQGANSLTTTYFGDFRADIDEANGTIRFLGAGNDFCAANTGNWAPLEDGSSGTAPAIYGFQANVDGPTFLGALRDFHTRADNFGPALTLYQNAVGSFGFASTQTITINAGSGTYSDPALGHGPLNFSGLNGPNQAGDGSLVDNGSSLRLTVPVDVTVNTTIAGQAATVHLQGTIVGSATIPVVHLGSGPSPNDYATSVVATQGPVNITDPAATVTDASSGAHLTTLTATLTNRPDGAQEFLSANVSGTGLTASYNAATGVETISGSATPVVYQGVLRTLTYVDNALTPDTHDRIIHVTASDGTSFSLVRTSTVTVYAPAQSFTVTDFPSTTTAGAAGPITVTAEDGNGNLAPGYTGTVHFTSSDGQATAGNGLPADYTFTAADHGVHTFTNVVLVTAGPQSITASDAANGSLTGAETNIAVVAAPAVSFMVLANSSQASGTPFDLTVVAVDAWGNVDTNYRGTVTFTTTDTATGVQLPASYTFQSGDAGMVTFTGGASLLTPGVQTIIVSDLAGSITGSVDVIIV
jgi:hypothetical protein